MFGNDYLASIVVFTLLVMNNITKSPTEMQIVQIPAYCL